MKKRSVQRAISLLCVLVLLFLQAACTVPDAGTGGSTTTTTTSGEGPSGPVPTVYPNGGSLSETGDRIRGDVIALQPVSYQEEDAVSKSAAEIKAFLSAPTGGAAGQILRVTEGTYTFDGALATYDGGGMILIAEEGVRIRSAEAIVLRNLTIVGPVSVTASVNITLENVRILHTDGVALTVNSASRGITVKNSRIEGKTAIENGADRLVLLNSYVGFAENGLLDTSREGLYVRDCRFIGESGSAIKTASDYMELRRNSIKTASDAVALAIGEAKHILIAANVITDAQRSIVMKGVDNASVLRNSVVSVDAANGKHIYLVDNAVGGRMLVSDNRYLILDGTVYPQDAFDHTTVSVGNNAVNGDGLTDLEKRLSAGANEELLPHVDKDQFLFEERQSTVYDPDGSMKIHEYVETYAAEDYFVYIAPRAYATYTCWLLDSEHRNSTIYAYGAYIERPLEGTTDGQDFCNDYWGLIVVSGTENITLKGGTYGFERPQCGQVYVLEKVKGSTQLITVPAAGMLPDFGATGTGDKLFELSGGNVFREGKQYAYLDLGSRNEVKNEDGTITVDVLRPNVWQQIEVGDVIACHNRLYSQATVGTKHSAGVLYQDMTVYGNTGAACFSEDCNTGAITYHRIADVVSNGAVIDKEVYDRYKAIEEEYGISTDVWFDGENYRGAPSRFSSKDTLHVAASVVGSQIISCYFENLVDDSTNQRSLHARLSCIYPNEDGETYTVVYKANLSKVSYDRGSRTPNYLCEHFEKGDRVFVYTSNGKLVVDGPALEDYTLGGLISTEYKNQGGGDLRTYCVKVAKEDVHLDALEGYVLDTKGAATSQNNSYAAENKVLVDNRSAASDGFLYDNCYVNNCRSRGMILKASDATIQHCTFRNISAAAIAICYEIDWGESGVSENVTVKNCIFDHTGFRQSYDIIAPITVNSLGYTDFSTDALYKNIKITDNVIKNRVSEYAVVINGAMDVEITGNDFGRVVDIEGLNKQKNSVSLVDVKSVTIADNKYPDAAMSVKNTFSFENVKGLKGSDVQDGDMFPECK